MNRIILAVSGLLMYNIIFAQTPTIHNDLNWQLKWEDNFSTFNDIIWIKAHNCDHGDEPQLFLDQNVWVAGGNLIIEVNNDRAYCPGVSGSGTCGGCVQGWRDFTSGWVETRTPTDYNPKFGYIEARIKLPFRPGFFNNAFWTWQAYGAQFNQAEIDIFEMGWHGNSNIVTTNIHTTYEYNEGYYQEHIFSNFSYVDWHTYSVEWDVNKIIWYVDGKSIRAITNHGIIDPIRIILSIGIKDAPTSPAFREYMYVDYVKVYQLKCDKNTPVYEITNYDNPQAPNYYNYAVKKLISLGGTSSLTAGQNVSLRAAEYIELTNGFEVPLGAELYLDISPCEMVKTGRQ